jgi:transposase-like protein
VSIKFLGGHVNTIDGRRRRRTHSAEFKAKVVAACREPGISIAAVALANGLNANLLRRWVVTTEPAQGSSRFHAASAPSASSDGETTSFLPLDVERPEVMHAQDITIELRRGATVVKVAWPLAAASDCAVWLRELLR